MSQRLQKLRQGLESAELDGLLVGSPIEDTFGTHAANRRYLSGFSGSMGWLLITDKDAFIIVDFRYWQQAAQECPGFKLIKAEGGVQSWVAPLIGESGLSGKKLGFEPGGLTVAAYESIKKGLETLPRADRPRLIAAPTLVEEVRVVKESEEITLIQRAVDIADQALAAVAPCVEPGWTEERVAREIEKESKERGADSLSFNTIVAAGPWGAMPHAQPRCHSIKAGEPIVIDMGVRVDGYCSDMTRTIIVGEPDDQFRRIYNIVLTAQLTAEELLRPGMTGGEAHGLAHRVIEEAGYGEKFGHGLGHGVGLLVHEAPRLSQVSKDELREGMVVTVEPGIYLPEWGGVRIEDMVVIERDGARLMTESPKLSV